MNMKLSVPMHVVTLLSRTRRRRRNFFSSSSSFSNPNHLPEIPNHHLISHYFSLLQSSPNPKHLRHLHAHLLRTSLFNNVILSSKLILSYSKHNLLLPYSHFVFLNIPNPNKYSWNMIIGEFSRSNFPEKSIHFFNQMRSSGFPPDEFTLPNVLRACVSCGFIDLGISVHGFCVKVGLVKSLFVASAMVFMYVNLGKIFQGRKVFDEMSQRDYILWTSMLAGYAQHGESMLALDVFKEMVEEEEGIELDWVVMVSLVLVFSQLGWLRHGKSVHGWCIRRCSVSNLSLTLGNALIDMYVKCGNLDNARSVFNRMPVKDVISWSSLILGYGLNGNMGFALELFDQMRSNGFKPNGVTFLGVLSACAHAGMVEKARIFFDMMKDYDVSVELKHYACMVDCLGRAGYLEEAEKFIEEMPVPPDGAVLGALLGGCRVHGDIEVAERTGKKLLRMEPERGGYYVLLANIYADSGRFREAERVREFMKQKNLSKLPGCSSIESDDCFNSSSGPRNKVLLDFES